MEPEAEKPDTNEPGSEPSALARIDTRERRIPRVGARVLTWDLAVTFTQILLSDVNETVESAALAAGLRPSTVRDAISRYNQDKCKTLEDEEICEIVVRAKVDHIKQIRSGGTLAARTGNRAGTSWAQWQSEVQAPLEHPRKQEMSVEMGGKDGGPIQTENTVRYVVSVPEEEPDE